MKDRFVHIYWFVVGLCAFGAGLTVFLIIFLPAEASLRIADTALIFWLSTAVAGGIGYLIGNSAKGNMTKPTPEGTTTANISAEIITDNTNNESSKES